MTETADIEAFQHLLVTRRTIHNYAVAPIPVGCLERALVAALAAPNHRLTEPWRFVLVGATARAALFQQSLELKQKKSGPMPESALDVARQKFMNPDTLLVICQQVHQDPSVYREDYAAVATAVQNLALSLWSEGVGSKWSTGAITTSERTYELLGIDRNVQEVVGFLWIGMGAGDVKKPARHLRVEDVLRRVP